jgi:tRNA G18 (ribose-2'-O)-methylase SpoU
VRRIDIVDGSDERLTDYTRLRDASLRKHLEVERGIFIAEGYKVIDRALRRELRPRSLLLAERWLAEVEPRMRDLDVPVYVVTEALAEEITGFHVHRGALGAFERPAPLAPESLLGAQRLIVLEDIVDHSNVGACFRSAAALGWDGVLVSPRCADPLYRRSIKVSMGAVLEMPWTRVTDHGAVVQRLRSAGFTVAALALTEDAVTLDAFSAEVRARPRPVALLLGTEGHGLSDAWLAQADRIVTIPMQRGIDSLNVAAASAVACYELRP